MSFQKRISRFWILSMNFESSDSLLFNTLIHEPPVERPATCWWWWQPTRHMVETARFTSHDLQMFDRAKITAVQQWNSLTSLHELYWKEKQILIYTRYDHVESQFGNFVVQGLWPVFSIQSKRCVKTKPY